MKTEMEEDRQRQRGTYGIEQLLVFWYLVCNCKYYGTKLLKRQQEPKQNKWKIFITVITLPYIFYILHARRESPNFLFKQVEYHLFIQGTEYLDKRIVY